MQLALVASFIHLLTFFRSIFLELVDYWWKFLVIQLELKNFNKTNQGLDAEREPSKTNNYRCGLKINLRETNLEIAVDFERFY